MIPDPTGVVNQGTNNAQRPIQSGAGSNNQRQALMVTGLAADADAWRRTFTYATAGKSLTFTLDHCLDLLRGALHDPIRPELEPVLTRT